MACCPKEENYGYEDWRFETDVEEKFHCSICYNVLKEPRMCKNNSHVFCLTCITQYLSVNSPACPQCKEHLSVDTLRMATSINDYLSKLKINCDNASRGCSEFTNVEDLKAHVTNCGFAPVVCSNKHCGMVINKQERVHHETEVCEYRKLKCINCEEIEEEVGILKGSLSKLSREVEATTKEIKVIQGDGKSSVRELDGRLEQLNEAVVTINKRHDEIEEVKNEVGQVRREIKDVKDKLLKVNQDVDEVKVMMNKMLEKINIFELLQKLSSQSEVTLNTAKQDILIAGGYSRSRETSKSTEIYSWENNAWVEVSPMNDDHIGASSCFYEDQLFVVGGDGSKNIETLNLTGDSPLRWVKFPGQLPSKCDDHQTVVYQQRIIHIGGFLSTSRKRTNIISEMKLTSTCTMKELCQMPQPRDCHSAEIFHDKVLILGGQKSNCCRDALDSVLEFNVDENECKQMPPLPHPLTEMATVRWGNQAVLLGGRDSNGEVMNDVFMYDCKTGKITALPSMLEKRYDCCAVITGNTIVVMGGMNEKDEYLNSVESHTIGSSTWKYIPAMNKPRWRAVAEVLPPARKYV